jgi:hypothetical protein
MEIILTDDQKGTIDRCRALEGGTTELVDSSLTEQGGGGQQVTSTISETVRWKPLESPSPFVAMHMRFDEEANKKASRSIAIGKAEAEIDTSAEELVAWLWDYCSNERMRISNEQRQPARLVISRPCFVEQEIATVKHMPLLFQNREFVFRLIFSRDDKSKILLAQESVPTSENVDYGRKLRVTRGQLKSLFSVKSLSPRSCEVAFAQFLDAGGNFPAWLMNKKVPQSLKQIVQAREEFARDDEIDEIERGKMAALMEWKGEEVGSVGV